MFDEKSYGNNFTKMRFSKKWGANQNIFKPMPLNIRMRGQQNVAETETFNV